MSLRKSPTLTPARIEANRRNAKNSTGPRTARGKAQSRMNSLRAGGRSALYEDLFLTLLDAPPGSVDRVAQALLTPEQAAHPLFAEAVEMFRQAEVAVVLHYREVLGQTVRDPCAAEGDDALLTADARAAASLSEPTFISSAERQKKITWKKRAKPESY